MNRQWLTVCAAFAAGLCLGGGMVWYGVERAVAPVPSTAADARDKSRSPSPTELLPVTLAPSRSQSSAEAPPPTDRLVEAHRLLAETRAAISSFKPDDFQPAVVSLIHRLRGLGLPGLQAIRDFLVSGEDVELHEYRISTSSTLFDLPTLRKALIHSLADWPDGPEATELSRETLRDAGDVEEAVLAIRNLEKHAPGIHREEALLGLREIISAQPAASLREAREVMETAWHFRAAEFMPQLEQLLNRWPAVVNEYFGALATFPIAQQQAAVSRAVSNAEVLAEISSDPSVLTQLDLIDPVMRSHILQVFAKLPAARRELYLQGFGDNARYNWGFSLMPGHLWGTDREQLRLEQAAKLQLIDALAPYATTPVLRQRVAEARSKLVEALQY